MKFTDRRTDTWPFAECIVLCVVLYLLSWSGRLSPLAASSLFLACQSSIHCDRAVQDSRYGSLRSCANTSGWWTAIHFHCVLGKREASTSLNARSILVLSDRYPKPFSIPRMARPRCTRNNLILRGWGGNRSVCKYS
jgi:hypothetical protein